LRRSVHLQDDRQTSHTQSAICHFMPDWTKTLSANYFDGLAVLGEGSGLQGCYAAMHPALSLQHALLSHISQGQSSVLMLCVYSVDGVCCGSDYSCNANMHS